MKHSFKAPTMIGLVFTLALALAGCANEPSNSEDAMIPDIPAGTKKVPGDSGEVVPQAPPRR